MTGYAETNKKLEALGRLPLGWDYGRGGPADRFSIFGARRILSLLKTLGLNNFDVVPGSDASVVVFGLIDNGEIEVVCEPHTTSFIYYRSPNGVEGEVEDQRYSDAISFIRGLDWLTQKSSILSAYNVILWQQEGSVAKPLPSHETVAEFRSFALNVSKLKVFHYANISPITRSGGLDQPHQFSGDLDHQIMQTIPA